MSITIELPPDIDQQVRDIPDVEKRVLSFLLNQVEYEKWRKARYSEQAFRLLEESKADAARMKAEGVPREELFRRFFEAYDQIAEKR
jgi:hypothetical protein